MRKVVCLGPGPVFKGGISNYNVSLAKAINDEPETEVVVEVVPASSGCHQTDKKFTFWKLFILLLTMYALGGIFGWLAAKHNQD